MDIYVGSIPFKLKEAQLKELFEKFGEVTSSKIIIDKITRQNKGFGFVTMPDDSAAQLAIEALNGSELDGRSIIVSRSEPKDKARMIQDSMKQSGQGHPGSGGGKGGKGGGFKGNSKGFNSNRSFNRKSS